MIQMKIDINKVKKNPIGSSNKQPITKVEDLYEPLQEDESSEYYNEPITSEPLPNKRTKIIYKRKPFLTRLIEVCVEDINNKLDRYRPQKKWDGIVPEIKPRYK